MENPASLWSQLQARYPDAVARVSSQFSPSDESLQQFLNRLRTMQHYAAIANDRCGTVGNPYEQAADDLKLLLCVAEKLTGLESSIIRSGA